MIKTTLAVREQVKVLIEKRKVSRVHVLHKTLNLVISCSCFADCMTFSKVIQFYFMDLVLRTSSRSDTKVRYVMTCLGG